MSSPSSLLIPILPMAHAAGLELPVQATIDSAGYDLHAAIDAPVILEPGKRQLIPCGFAMMLPKGYEAQIRPRSGLAFKHGVTVLNAPGTIDADYRGELKVLLYNTDQQSFTIERGMRIAQLVIARYENVNWQSVTSFTNDESLRGTKGFGSTGI